MRKHASTLAILPAIVALFAVAMVLGTRQSTGDGETFIGTDAVATTHIEENHPGYTPWLQPIDSSPSARGRARTVRAAGSTRRRSPRVRSRHDARAASPAPVGCRRLEPPGERPGACL